jgi:predicted phosphodiesterase
MMKRFGLIGDVHAQDRLLEIALEYLQDVDAILCVGDFADGRGDLDRTLKLLRDPRVRAVRGNHDRWIVNGQMRELPDATQKLSGETREYLAQLPPTMRIETVAGPLLLAHGLGRDDMLGVSDRYSLGFHFDGRWDRRLEIDPDIAIHVSGHSHQRWAERVHGLLAVNAGTLLEREFGLLDLAEMQLQWLAIDEGVRVAEQVDLTE